MVGKDGKEKDKVGSSASTETSVARKSSIADLVFRSKAATEEEKQHWVRSPLLPVFPPSRIFTSIQKILLYDVAHLLFVVLYFQVPDEAATKCSNCDADFSAFVRRVRICF